MARRIVGRGRCRPNKTSSWNRTRGAIVVWAAFMLFAIVGVVGFGLDGARLYIDAHQLQNAVDSAALAGAQYVKVGYLDAADPNQHNEYEYPAVVFRIAQEFANQNKASRATVNLDVPNLSAFDETVDVVIGYYRLLTRQFTPYDPYDADAKVPNAVKVVARQTGASAVNNPLPLIFGSIVGVDSADVVRVAIAISTGATGAGLIALDEYPEPKPTGLRVPGNSTLNVGGGDVQVNSWSNDHPWYAFQGDGNFNINADDMHVVGAVDPPLDDPYWDSVDFNVQEFTENPLPDPLGHIPDMWDPILGIESPTHEPGYYTALPAPTWNEADPNTYWRMDRITASTAQDHGIWNEVEQKYVLTLQSGYYPGGLDLNSNVAKVILQPGIYALGGGWKGVQSGLVIKAGASLEALGVMLYITKAMPRTIDDIYYPGQYGQVQINGGESVIIHESYDPENPGGDHYIGYEGTEYEYIAIFQDRRNETEAYVTGGAEIDLEGSLYFKNANFRVGGSGLEAGTQLVAGTVEIAGNSVVTVNYDGRFWRAGFKSLLVE
jgi:Flp pilus assembly protein TadG